MKMQIISFHCILKNKFGHVISSTFNQDILTGPEPKEQQLPALSVAMQDLKLGEKRMVSLHAVDAYGFFEMKKDAKPIYLNYEGKRQQFRVIGMTSDDITLDGNHPLAGQDLIFEIETLSVRDATAEEISESLVSQHSSKNLYH
jgi:FKBP-type peptidyl-prolyl cis-trans isomerase SlyD